MEPCFEDGKIVGSVPYFMFQEVEGIEKSPKEFSVIIKSGVQCHSTFGFIWPLNLKQRYTAGPGLFLEAFNYIRFLDLRKDLILEFEVIITQ